jgi:segregation and condensation protein B
VEFEQQKRLAEALILASPEPLSAARLADLIPRCKAAAVAEVVESLNGDYRAQGRAFEIIEVAGGFQLRTLPEFAPYLQQLSQTRPLRLSPAALETLAVVAYRQPVTRAEVEFVRGVDVGAVLRSLLERKLVRIAGHREVPGHPLVYATTRRFLEVFGLAKLDDLPTLRELSDLSPSGEATQPESEGVPEEASAADADSEVAELVDEGAEQLPGSDGDAGDPLEAAVQAFADAEPVGEPH